MWTTLAIVLGVLTIATAVGLALLVGLYGAAWPADSDEGEDGDLP